MPIKSNNLIEQLVIRAKTLIVLTFPLFYTGIGTKFPWSMLGQNGVGFGMIFFFSCTVLFLAACLTLPLERVTTNLINKIFFGQLILACLFIIGYDWVQYKHFAHFGYRNPHQLYILTLILLISVIALYLKFKNNWNKLNQLLFPIITIFIVLHNLWSLSYFPLTAWRSDMLLAITNALNNFLQGVNPYLKTIPGIGIPPYLPVTTLSFLPAVIYKLDPRIIGIFYTVITLLLIQQKFKYFNNLDQITLLIVFINPYWLMRHDLYFQFFILELVIIFLYFKHFNLIIQSVFLGIFITTLQFAWILYPFILLASSNNIINLTKRIIISLLTGSLIIIYYVGNSWQSFINATFLHKEYLHPYGSDITFGLSPIFYFASNQKILYATQLIVCLAILIITLTYYCKNKNSFNNNYYLTNGAICYFCFIITNYFIETYLLIPVLFTIALVSSRNSKEPCYRITETIG